LVAPFSAGGADAIARAIAQALSDIWKQDVIVENRPGAGSQVGTLHVARSKPDGYTILISSSAFTTLPAVRSDVPYDIFKDFEPISLVAFADLVVAVGPNVKANSIGELIEEQKMRKMYFGTSGAGTSSHLLGEGLNLLTGMNLQAVHYKGGSEAVLDVAAGRTDAFVGAVNSLLPMIDSGKVRLLATIANERRAYSPDTPTLREAGVDGAENLSVWWGMFVPKGTPADIVDQINAAVTKAIDQVKNLLSKTHAVKAPMSRKDFEELLNRDYVFWKSVSEQRGLTE